jgi:hypothetical protein
MALDNPLVRLELVSDLLEQHGIPTWSRHSATARGHRLMPATQNNLHPSRCQHGDGGHIRHRACTMVFFGT